MSSDTLPGRRRLAWSTAIFSLLTAGSRALGLIREMVVAYLFGAQGAINAFTVAFQIPNLIRALAADLALTAAFVPVFSELLAKDERARAWRLASTLLWLALLGLGALVALLVLLAPWTMRVFGYDGAGGTDLVVDLSRILFPIVVLLGAYGVIAGILNSYEEFSIPALTPILWNVAIILALVFGVPQAETETAKLSVYAGGVLAGTFVQVLLPIPWLRGRDGRLRLVIDVRDPAVKRVFALMFPVTLGVGLINFNLVVNTLFASAFLDPNLAPNAIDKAFRLYMLPQGIFSVAVTTVLFPSLSRLAALGESEGFRNTLAAGLRQIGFLLIPAGAVSAALALPITRLVYERGAFGPQETDVVAACLAAFSAGLLFNGTMLMLNRGFFSLQSPWVPTAVALGNLALNVTVNAALYRVGVWGIPLATSTVNLVGTVVLIAILRRRLGGLGEGVIVGAYTRMLLAATLAAGAAFGVWWEIDGGLGRSAGAQVVSLGAALAAAGAVYLGVCRLLAVRELDTLLSLRSRRRRDNLER